MTRKKRRATSVKSILGPSIALIFLLGIASYALLGPTGIIAWTDYKAEKTAQTDVLAKLEKERDRLLNQQRLLNKDNVDADLAGELMRRDLNVAAPDEIVVPMK
jgi:cell division protein FtsB